VAEPLAIQLVEALAPAPGARVITLLDEGDLLGRLLRDRGAQVVAWDPGSPPPRGDAAASLLALGFTGAARTLAALTAALARTGLAVHVVYSAADPPALEEALARAARGIGIVSSHLARLVSVDAVPAGLRGGYATARLRDVARFDGFAQLWRAVVEETPLGEELAGEAEGRLAGMRAALAADMRPWTAADGTLRIPITAHLLSGPSG
jgi:hypothetical protein